MIRFIIKGLLRDRSRSLFPILAVVIGVMLTVFLHGWLGGFINDMISSNANFSTGHLKIMTRAYSENEDQIPNDLALLGTEQLLTELRDTCSDIHWTPRIRFGGLVDIPDENGETRSQGTTMGMAVDLLSPNSVENKTLRIERAIVRGQMPKIAGEILISDQFAQKLRVFPGDTATLISSTMYGSLALQNFTIAGTLNFGVAVMDKSATILDIADAQRALDMKDAASEILGFFDDQLYHEERADDAKHSFNATYSDPDDEFSALMLTLKDQNGLGEYIDYVTTFMSLLVFIFVTAMSLVLWNVGLLGGLRRYGEVGVRMAIGEDRGHIYRSMIMESVFIGLVGSIMGTIIGYGIVYYVQVKGFNIGAMMKSSTLLISDVIRTRVTPATYYIGFIPGLFSTILGTLLSGIGIYKRKTAQLFKELET